MKDSQKAIEELIRLCGFTQKVISENSGFTEQQFGQWKLGKINISLENYIHLCKSNGINPDLPLINIAQSESLEKYEKECLKSRCNNQK